jgi:hypothetical protein
MINNRTPPCFTKVKYIKALKNLASPNSLERKADLPDLIVAQYSMLGCIY